MHEEAEATFMGVCAHISNKLDLDVFFVRCAFVTIFCFTGGAIVLPYVLIGIFCVEE